MFRATKSTKITIVAISLLALVVMSPAAFAKSKGDTSELDDGLKSVVTSLKSTVSKLVADFSSLKIQQQTNIQDIASLKQTVAALGVQGQTDANDIKSFKQSIATQASQIADLQNTVNSQAALIAQLNQAVASLQNSQIKINLLANFPSNGVQTTTANQNLWGYDAHFQVLNGVGQPINIDSALNGITLTMKAATSFVPDVFYVRHDQDPGTQPNEYEIVFYTTKASLSNVSATIGGIPNIGAFTTPVF